MNARHQITRKINRLRRLVRKAKDAPTDGNKSQRIQELTYELGKNGIRI